MKRIAAGAGSLDLWTGERCYLEPQPHRGPVALVPVQLPQGSGGASTRRWQEQHDWRYWAALSTAPGTKVDRSPSRASKCGWSPTAPARRPAQRGL
jgi:hypothetical protein